MYSWAPRRCARQQEGMFRFETVTLTRSCVVPPTVAHRRDTELVRCLDKGMCSLKRRKTGTQTAAAGKSHMYVLPRKCRECRTVPVMQLFL